MDPSRSKLASTAYFVKPGFIALVELSFSQIVLVEFSGSRLFYGTKWFYVTMSITLIKTDITLKYARSMYARDTKIFNTIRVTYLAGPKREGHPHPQKFLRK